MSGQERRRFERWAQFRFSVVGLLLAAPPGDGEVCAAIEQLAAKTWQHPITRIPFRVAFSTIERWYYLSRVETDPVGALRQRLRKDAGTQTAVTVALAEAARCQYTAHPSWSYQLHRDNLLAQCLDTAIPSYATLRRFMVSEGLLRQPRHKGREPRAGELTAAQRVAEREVRSYEVTHVGGLWHLDFHHASRKVVNGRGEWVRPLALAILDDHSRLACHVQWYLGETAEILVHGLCQAFLKRGLPRALLTDNGSAMIAAETRQGLGRLSIDHQTTLPYSPYQNGKQESFWGSVEGRLLAMLEGEPTISLSLLNEATQAWVELEYQHNRHSQTGQPPLQRFRDSPTVVRPCPSVDDLRLAFTDEQTRRQRRSDGTITVSGVRFEVPSRFRHLTTLAVRYASWDLRHVFVVDARTGVPLASLFPQDKARNADGVRRAVELPNNAPTPEPAGLAPLLRKLMVEYAATGLPPAYIPKEDP